MVASRDSDLPVTVPSQSETECVANQTSGQTPSQSDDNSQMVRKENVVKTRSGLSKFQLGFVMMTHKVYHNHARVTSCLVIVMKN